MSATCRDRYVSPYIAADVGERTGDAITEEEDGRRAGEGAIGQNGLALVMSEAARGMAVHYLPLSVGLHDGVVGDDLYVFCLLIADQFREDGADEGGHSAGNARVRNSGRIR